MLIAGAVAAGFDPEEQPIVADKKAHLGQVSQGNA